MSTNTKELDKAIDFITKATELLEKPEHKEAFVKNVESLKLAKSMAADNEEKHAYLYHAAISFANQIAFFLFRHSLLSDELAETYRSFPTSEETQAKVQEFNVARQSEIDRINGEQKEVADRIRGLDIFKAVVGGMSKEEADEAMKKYEAEVAAAQKQAARVA